MTAVPIYTLEETPKDRSYKWWIKLVINDPPTEDDYVALQLLEKFAGAIGKTDVGLPETFILTVIPADKERLESIDAAPPYIIDEDCDLWPGLDKVRFFIEDTVYEFGVSLEG